MKKLFEKMSRRERLYLIIGAAVLLFGLVIYPLGRKAAAFREEQFELLEGEIELRDELFALEMDGFAIEDEHALLSKALANADNLLFPPIKNRILTQTYMIKLLNQIGPDLELETTAGRSSVGDGANQMNLKVQGTGRYPEILTFLRRVETYRPLMLIDDFQLSQRRTRRRFGRGRTSSQQTSEPELQLSMTLQMFCQDGGEK